MLFNVYIIILPRSLRSDFSQNERLFHTIGMSTYVLWCAIQRTQSQNLQLFMMTLDEMSFWFPLPLWAKGPLSPQQTSLQCCHVPVCASLGDLCMPVGALMTPPWCMSHLCCVSGPVLPSFSSLEEPCLLDMWIWMQVVVLCCLSHSFPILIFSLLTVNWVKPI